MFRLEVCATDDSFAGDVLLELATSSADSNLRDLIELGPHDHGAPSPATVLVAASNAPYTQQLNDCVDRALDAGQPVVPVIDDIAAWAGRLPPRLASMNAVGLSGDHAGRKILESAGFMVPLRGVFLSHRRSDGAAMALQLAGELRKRGIGTFVDVIDIEPSAAVQDAILEALDQLACLVLLESPDSIGSEWVAKEVVYAQSRHLGTLSLCWAPKPTPDNPNTRFSQFDRTDRIDIESYLDPGAPAAVLSDAGVTMALEAILWEFSQALFFRRSSLQAELEAVLPDLEPRGPWRFVLPGRSRRTAVSLAPYQPDAKDLHQLAQYREKEQAEVAVLVHHPISATTPGALTLAWIGDKGPEAALGSDVIDRLSGELDL